MRILYAYGEDAHSIKVQSGRPYSIYRTFQRRGHEIVDLFPLRRRRDSRYVYDKFKGWLSGRKYAGERYISYLYEMKLIIEEAIVRRDPDLVFSPSSIPLSLVSKGRCRIFTADATFDGLAGLYPRLSSISEQYSREAYFQEWIAMRTADFCVYPSEWAASSARKVYGAVASNVHVIPFGANIEKPPSSDDIADLIDKRNLDRLQFVFIGGDWRRKGGDVAVRLIEMLNRGGIPAHLQVIGVAGQSDDATTFHGYLDKSNENDIRKFTEIVSKAHFFLLPTSAEAYGLSFCEAMCYGLPCIARRVGGVVDIITENHNGFFLDEPVGTAFFDKIRAIIEDREVYRTFCRNARQSYESRFTWEAYVAGIERLVEMHRE
jgi:glycosyltransferase involved in cell wall biosynthesis